MDPRDGRRKAPRPRALIAIVVANLVAAGLLIHMLSGEGSVAAGERSAATGTPAEPQGAQQPGGAPDPGPARGDPAQPSRPTLQGCLETAIANALRRATSRSGGRVDQRSAAVAVHVIDIGGAGELVDVQAGAAMRPASNMKLLTAAAALVLLGPDWHFETPFEARGSLLGGTLEGDLVARAAGDPLFLQDSDGGLEPWLDDLARQLREAGVERVTGELVLDEGSFLEPGPGPGWPTPRDHWQEYCALAGGFTANAGCLTASLRAGAVGERAAVKVRPRDHGLARRGTVSTGAKGSRLDLAVGANAAGVTVKGSLPADVPEYATRFAHPDPVALFGEALVAGLARRGVVIEGGFRRERGTPPGNPVARLRSPLADTLVPILTHSNNSLADQVFLAMGNAVVGSGDRGGGQAATRRALETLGVSSAGLVQVDGSGLSRDDRVTPRQLTALIAAVLDQGGEVARRFRDALPVAGESGGLESRMGGGPAAGRVRAKTGFIGGTSSLSGLCETLDGRTLAFSILVSYPRVAGLNTRVWKPMQDEICELLVSVEAARGGERR